MGQIDKDTFICIDCETTGLDSHQDRIIEVAAAKFNFQGIIEEYETLVDPECLIPETSIAIHHISQDMVQGKPVIAQVLPDLLKFIGNSIIVGHGVHFDMQIIHNSAVRHNIPSNLISNRYIDTLRMARLYGESPINSLEKLRQHFNIENEGAHRAMSDVIVNISVFKQLSRRFKTTEQVLDILLKPILMKAMPLGKHKGRSFKDIPLEYLQWASHKDFDEDLLHSLRVEITRRRKGGHFSESGNPFSQLL